MKTELVLATEATAHIINNLYPLYLYDLSEVADWGRLIPNQHGLVEPRESSARTLGEQYGTFLTGWWDDPERRLPYIIRVEGKPVGFALVAGQSDGDTGHILCEYFIARPNRGRGLGRDAAHRLFGMLPGRWQLDVMRSNTPALTFWRNALSPYAETLREQPEGDDIVFRFSTGPA